MFKRPLPGGSEVSIDHIAVPAAGDDPAAEATDSISAQEAIDRLVSALTPDQAEVVLLRIVAGLSGGEVRAPGRRRGGKPRRGGSGDSRSQPTEGGGAASRIAPGSTDGQVRAPGRSPRACGSW